MKTWNILRHRFKEDLDVVKDTTKDVEKRLSNTKEDVESLKEAVKNVPEVNAYSIEATNKRILDLEKQLKLETERSTKLEQVGQRVSHSKGLGLYTKLQIFLGFLDHQEIFRNFREQSQVKLFLLKMTMIPVSLEKDT